MTLPHDDFKRLLSNEEFKRLFVNERTEPVCELLRGRRLLVFAINHDNAHSAMSRLGVPRVQWRYAGGPHALIGMTGKDLAVVFLPGWEQHRDAGRMWSALQFIDRKSRDSYEDVSEQLLGLLDDDEGRKP